MRLLELAASQGWAMLPDRAEQMVAIAEREHTVTPEVLEAYRAQQLERSERAAFRDGVAILYVDGPLFKRANLFVNYSGATSYEILRRDLQSALDNPEVASVLLIVDSPGGEANGCDEIATAIYAARSVKPITAFVSGMAASGGYWIAAAASRVVVSDAAMLGSIGVVLGVRPKGPNDKTIDFVSSQSPGKRPDVTTDVGKGQIQTMVDDLAEVFVAAVARYRGVTVDHVIKNFGAGGMKVGAKAVAAGMADQVGQLENVIASMPRTPATPLRRRQPFQIAAPNSVPLVAAPVGTTQTTAGDSRDRLRAILAGPDAALMPSVAQMLAFGLDLPGHAAMSILEAARADFQVMTAADLTPRHSQLEMEHAFLVKQIRAGSLGTENLSLVEKGKIT
jgi:ClpP class serine protease